MKTKLRHSSLQSFLLGCMMMTAPQAAMAVSFDDYDVIDDVKYGLVEVEDGYEAYVAELDIFEDDFEYVGDIVVPGQIKLWNGQEAIVVGVDDRAFYAAAVTSVTLPNTVKTVGKQAFGLCSSLTSVKIGSGIEKIGSKAFFPDAKLTTMFVDAVNPPVIASDALMNDPERMTLFVPAEAVDAYKEADIWNTVGTILSQDKMVSVTKIEVTPSNANLVESGRLQLSATVYPAEAEQKVSWISSNTKVASVSVNGEVYGNKNGVCTIYACATDGSGERGECVITVGSGKILELSRPYISGYEGEVYSISATVSPDDTSVEWSVADTGIATVSADGLSANVNLIGVGNTVLTATASNGLSQEIEIMVKKEITLTAIDVDPDMIELKVGEYFFLYEFDVNPVPEDVSEFNPNFYIEDTAIVDYDEDDIDGETFICVAPGTTRLVWKQGDIEGYCTIIVKGDEEVLLTDIELDPSYVSENLKAGDTIRITAIPIPADATDFYPVWSSSNPAVAKVDDTGLVTIISTSEDVVITCTSGSVKVECPIYLMTVGVGGVAAEISGRRVVTVDGTVLYEDASREDLDNLLPGLYIVNGEKLMIKK